MTYIGNRGGIPIVTATLSEAGTADTVATYTLPNHTFRNAGNAGIILINFNTATAEATGVTLQVNND